MLVDSTRFILRTSMRLFVPLSQKSIAYSIGDDSETFALIVSVKFEHVAKVSTLSMHTLSTMAALISYARKEVGASKFLSFRHTKLCKVFGQVVPPFANGR